MIQRSKRYRRIGERLMQTDPDLEDLRCFDVKIAFLSSDKEKIQNHKIIFADCRKVSDQYSWICPYDFMITVYEPNVLDFTRKQFEILIKHELLHVGISEDGDDPSFYVAPHDVEDFYAILNQYGSEWAKKEDKNAKRR